MKKMFKRIVSTCMALAIVFSISSLPAFAASEQLVKSGTSSTPVGTITGKVYLGTEFIVGHGMDYYWRAITSINSATNMSLVETSIDCVYNDTGTAPGDWSNSSATANSKTNEVSFNVGGADVSRGVTAYTAHQVTATKSYVLYLVSKG